MQNVPELKPLEKNRHSLLSSFRLAWALATLMLWMGCNSQGKSDAPPAAGDKSGQPGVGKSVAGGPPPTTVSAKRMRLESFTAPLSLNGTLLANQEVELRAEMSGKVTEIFFSEGRAVKSGAVMVQIDDAEVKANLLRAQARLKLAVTQESRIKQQLDAGAASSKDYDQATAERSQAEAELALLKAQTDKTQVRAPFAAIAGLLPLYKGAFVQPGTRITTLQDVSRLKLEFAVPEQEAWRIQIGSRVRFLATGRSDTLNAEIYALEPRLNAETRAMSVRAYVKPSGELIPGGFAEVIVGGGEQDSALVVPPSAISMAGMGAMLYVPKDGIATLRPVRLGGRTPTAVQILSGIEVGDTVIVSGFMAIRPGAPVLLQMVP
jgi:membrane fusion protein, multidrug efflux system